MPATSFQRETPYGFGLASLVLGAVGLILFFLPVLGIPLAGIGSLFGLAGLLAALCGGRSSLRWSALGTALCVLALAADIAIALAPGDALPHQAVPRTWQPATGNPYVAPPADPRIWLDDRDSDPPVEVRDRANSTTSPGG